MMFEAHLTNEVMKNGKTSGQYGPVGPEAAKEVQVTLTTIQSTSQKPAAPKR